MIASTLNATYAAYKAHPDEQGINALFTACRTYASQIARSHDAPDWEDIAQDAVIKVWSWVSTYKGQSEFSAWLRSIVNNLVIDYHRRSSVRPPVNDVPLDTAPIERNRIKHQAVHDPGELYTLTPTQRAVVDSLIQYDADVELTAAAMGITPKTLRNHLSHIRHQNNSPLLP